MIELLPQFIGDFDGYSHNGKSLIVHMEACQSSLRIIHVGSLPRSVGDCRGARRREEVTLGKFSLENSRGCAVFHAEEGLS